MAVGWAGSWDSSQLRMVWPMSVWSHCLLSGLGWGARQGLEPGVVGWGGAGTSPCQAKASLGDAGHGQGQVGDWLEPLVVPWTWT